MFRSTTDISKVKMKVEEKEQFLVKLLQNFPNGSVNVFDRELRYVLAEGKGLEKIGLSAETLVGKSLYELFDPESIAVVEPFYRRAFEGEACEFELPLNGYTFRINVTPIEEEGKVKFILVLAQDITEHKATGKRLRQSEERFRAYVKASSDVVYQMNADWTEMCHLEGREFIADTLEPSTTWIDKYIHPDDRAHVTAAIDKAIRTRSLFELEHRVIRVDGTLGWTCSRALPILDEQGEIVEWFGAASDVTERRLAEEALREGEGRYRALFDSIDEGVCLIERLPLRPDGRRDYRYIAMNPAMQGMFGIPDLSGQSIRDNFPDEVEDWYDDYDRVLASGQPIRFERESAPQGMVLEMFVTRLEDGSRQRLLVVMQDVTVRKRAEESLHENKSRFDLVKDGAQVGFWFCDLPFDKLIWDNRVKEHFWLPPEAEVTINTFYEQLHPDDRERTRQAIDESIANQTQYEIEYRTLSTAGQEKWIRAIGRTFYDAQGSPIRFDGVTLDLTERKRAEEALLEANRRKDEFLAMLAHELRNPLAPIRNAAQVLKLIGPGDADQQWAREVIERQTQHLTRLVDDLLDVSRITSGKIVLQREELDLSIILNRAIEASRPLIDKQRHQMTLTLPTEPLLVEGDLTRLVQVVSNLLNNAAKYTDEGGQIWLGAARAGDEAIIRVRDNGIGLSADLLPHIFDLFSQADQSLDRAQGGLGIGLTLVRQLVELHGGHVEARSAGAQLGSEFIVRLPLIKTSAAEAASTGRKSETPNARRKSPLRVLVVEDNSDSAEMMGFLLRLDDHEVRLAQDGFEAIEVAQVFQPQVVLCDLGLPGKNGYEVARELRNQPSFQKTRLIALSGYGHEEARRQAKEAGFDYHLVKPVEPDALKAILDALVSNDKPPG